MDPYKVLGVDRNASDEEIKKAYRELVKKYHPDKYSGSDLKDIASEKLKEVNAAYDEIQRMRSSRGSSSGSSYSGGSSGSYYGGYQSAGGSAKYNAVRQKIQAGDLNGAEALLNNISPQDAEWHYLKGVILLRRGWYDGARQHFASAHSMDPTNREYAQAFASANNMGRGYTDYYGGGQNIGGCNMCDFCTGMMCANLCCGDGCC